MAKIAVIIIIIITIEVVQIVCSVNMVCNYHYSFVFIWLFFCLTILMAGKNREKFIKKPPLQPFQAMLLR